MRKEPRVIGIDDMPFTRQDKKVGVIATFYRGGEFMDGLMSTEVTRDGTDSTTKLSSMIKKSKFYKQVRAIFCDGIALGGFNVIDIHRLSAQLSKPVIVIVRKKPDREKILKALFDLGLKQQKKILESVDPPKWHKRIYFQHVGTSEENARELIDLCTTHSKIPEALRMAHIIGAGVKRGESYGRA